MTITDRLIKKDGDWRLDDEKSPFRTPTGGGPPGGGGTPGGGSTPSTDATPGAHDFGDKAAFSSIPGIGPATSITLVASEPIDPGRARNGARRAKGRFGNDFGQPGRPVRVRFVNLPVTLINTGRRPFRGDLTVEATSSRGRQFSALERRDVAQRGQVLGRLPDWTMGEERGIAPGSKVTRFLTLAVPAGARITRWRVQPHILSRPGTIASMDPDGAVYGER